MTDLRWSWYDGPPIPDGVRHSTLCRIAGALRGKGATYDELLRDLSGINASRCRPPLPSREIEVMARTYSRYPATRGPRGPTLPPSGSSGESRSLT